MRAHPLVVSSTLPLLWILAGCSSRIESVQIPWVPTVLGAPSDWTGSAVFVDSDVEDLTAVVEEGFARSKFIVVGSREEAVLVITVRQTASAGTGGSRGGQSYIRSDRTINARATLDGRPIADGEVTLKFTLAAREDESHAEFEWRQSLEEDASRKWLGNAVVIDLVEHLPLRASIAAPVGSVAR